MNRTLRLRRAVRIARKIAWGLLDRNHPFLAHSIAMRRRNLSCGAPQAIAASLPTPCVRAPALAVIGDETALVG